MPQMTNDEKKVSNAWMEYDAVGRKFYKDIISLSEDKGDFGACIEAYKLFINSEERKNYSDIVNSDGRLGSEMMKGVENVLENVLIAALEKEILNIKNMGAKEE